MVNFLHHQCLEACRRPEQFAALGLTTAARPACRDAVVRIKCQHEQAEAEAKDRGLVRAPRLELNCLLGEETPETLLD